MDAFYIGYITALKSFSLSQYIGNFFKNRYVLSPAATVGVIAWTAAGLNYKGVN
jgi:hypothetical protein